MARKPRVTAHKIAEDVKIASLIEKSEGGTQKVEPRLEQPAEATKRKSNKMWAVAYHEAGHAVVARHFFRLSEEGVSIIPEQGQQEGITHINFPARCFRPKDNEYITGRSRRTCETFALISLAAYLSPQRSRASSYRIHHSEQDRKEALDVLTHTTEAKEEVDAGMRLLELQARNLVNRMWPKIEAVATALMERRHLTKSEVEQIAWEAVTRGAAIKGSHPTSH
jgi:hypothetical protein